jgi:tripartite-type tricarboxylate transporter receptor subunit TctC
MRGAKFNLVPCKGDAESVLAAAGGHVDMAPVAGSTALSMVEAKKMGPVWRDPY